MSLSLDTKTALKFNSKFKFEIEEEESKNNIDFKQDEEEDRWSKMLPDLLREIIKRLETSEDKWPNRKSVVSFACVCKRWREAALEIVKPPLESRRITFPFSLKQAGPREFPMMCFIKRNKKNSTFYLYLSLTKSFVEKGKFLLAARRVRNGGCVEYVISLDADDISQRSNAYQGKLRADFLGTKFTIYDSQPPYNGAKSSDGASRRFGSKQISPQGSSGNYKTGHIAYKFNLLKSRGPRRMNCTFRCQPEQNPPTNDSKPKSKCCSSNNNNNNNNNNTESSTIVLKNKVPRWHEHLQCWCLNFHGRVTVASVKNFQLVATVDPSQEGNIGDEEVVLLQFGKVGDDLFTMDYRQPLSAFQAFAICLTSFGTKFGCE